MYAVVICAERTSFLMGFTDLFPVKKEISGRIYRRLRG